MRVSLYAEGVTEPLVPFVVSRTARRPSTVPCCTRWIGFLNDLFYGRSYIAAPAELSIPVLLDEKSTVVPVRLAGEQSGGKRKREWARGSDQRKVLRPTGTISKLGVCAVERVFSAS